MIFAAVLALSSCAAPRAVVTFRDPQQPIYSSAVLNPASIIGVWSQVAHFAERPGCLATGVRFSMSGPGLRMDGQLCLAGKPTTVAGPMAPVGPGRFAQTGVSDAIWVLWADTDVRTLVLGTPSGVFGMILNRDDALPADRLTAAREILAWNGYDLDRLHLNP